MIQIKGDAWKKFIDESMDMDGNTNFRFPFGIMTKKYGQCYIEFCREMWSANEGVMTEEEFMKMNADMPRSFFEKAIK